MLLPLSRHEPVCSRLSPTGGLWGCRSHNHFPVPLSIGSRHRLHHDTCFLKLLQPLPSLLPPGEISALGSKALQFGSLCPTDSMSRPPVLLVGPLDITTPRREMPESLDTHWISSCGKAISSVSFPHLTRQEGMELVWIKPTSEAGLQPEF